MVVFSTKIMGGWKDYLFKQAYIVEFMTNTNCLFRQA